MFYTLIISAIVLSFLAISVMVVKQQKVRVIERLGKFKRVVRAGLSFKIPFIDREVAELDLRTQQLNVEVETKTKDNVFVSVKIAVQAFVMPDKVYEAVYKLEDPQDQIKAYVYDVVRSQVPSLTLDEVFEKKEEIALAVKKDLAASMDDFGYNIVTALLIDIDPDAKVKASMNEINAQKRLREAAMEKAEAEKIMIVKNAEAEAESKKLQGEGIANQRRAIIAGLKESVKDLSEATGVRNDEVMNLVLLTQYFDTLKDIGTGGKSNTVFLPNSPSGMQSFANEIRTAILSSK